MLDIDKQPQDQHQHQQLIVSITPSSDRNLTDMNSDDSPTTTTTTTGSVTSTNNDNNFSSSSTSSSSLHNVHEPETLWVGDLPLNSTEQDVINAFHKYNNVLDVQIKRTSDFAKYPLNYAFVKMQSREIADKAYRDYVNNPKEFSIVCQSVVSQIRVGWAKTNTTLHVSNLDISTTETMISTLFKPYGEIISTVLHQNTNNILQSHTIYFTVTFASRDDAEEARIALNGYNISSRIMKVEWNKKKKLDSNMMNNYGRSPLMGNSSPNNSNTAVGNFTNSVQACLMNNINNVISIYIQFESTDTSNTKVTEAFLKDIFESFGNFTGCYIKSSYNDGRRQHGYGFAHFENDLNGLHCARTAANVIGNHGRFMFEGVTIRAELSKNFCKAMELCSNGNTVNSSNMIHHSACSSQMMLPQQMILMKQQGVYEDDLSIAEVNDSMLNRQYYHNYHPAAYIHPGNNEMYCMPYMDPLSQSILMQQSSLQQQDSTYMLYHKSDNNHRAAAVSSPMMPTPASIAAATNGIPQGSFIMRYPEYYYPNTHNYDHAMVNGMMPNMYYASMASTPAHNMHDNRMQFDDTSGN